MVKIMMLMFMMLKMLRVWPLKLLNMLLKLKQIKVVKAALKLGEKVANHLNPVHTSGCGLMVKVLIEDIRE